MVGDDRRSEGVHQTVGDTETPHAAARSAHGHPGVLLLTGRAGELQQVVWQRRRAGRQVAKIAGSGEMRNRPVVVLASVVALSMPLLAHHGSAAFDTGKKMVLKG